MNPRAFPVVLSTSSKIVCMSKLTLNCQSPGIFNMNILRSALPIVNVRNIHCVGRPLNFQFTPILNAEPLKKKRRIDPSILRERSERKVRRLQREIRRLEKVAKKYKPITEAEVPKQILRESQRVRAPPVLSEDEIQRRSDIQKNWAIYKYHQHHREINMINKLIACQEKAMDELKDASLELYEEALQVDLSLIPLRMTGPVRTPPIENFNHPEGAFIDVTKVYKPIVPIEPKNKKGRINARKNKRMELP